MPPDLHYVEWDDDDVSNDEEEEPGCKFFQTQCPVWQVPSAKRFAPVVRYPSQNAQAGTVQVTTLAATGCDARFASPYPSLAFLTKLLRLTNMGLDEIVEGTTKHRQPSSVAARGPCLDGPEA